MDVQQTVTRYKDVSQQKHSGAVYTPPALAQFVAREMLDAAKLPPTGPIRLLDPALGDGMLLLALLRQLQQRSNDILARVQVFGFDTDELAVLQARQNLQTAFPAVHIQIEQRDFLDYLLDTQDLLCVQHQATAGGFDLVIANPPYVRTQILGRERARALALAFGLQGRVDLYYPFLLGIAQILRPDGIVGAITSNRFMSTQSGQTVRRALLARFELLHVWDFGDSKLFSTAVLPAVMLARARPPAQLKAAMASAHKQKKSKQAAADAEVDADVEAEAAAAAVTAPDINTGNTLADTASFGARAALAAAGLAGASAQLSTRLSSIYACDDAPAGEIANADVPDVFAALAQADGTLQKLVDGRVFHVRHGRLENGGSLDGVWRVGNADGDAWLATVARHTWDNFAGIGKIRVGVKSTADKVFVRADWDDLPGGAPELLRPLITRHCGRRFRAQLPPRPEQRKQILYPHQSTISGRAAVDLALYPKAQRYLEQHRAQLESREYLSDAKRNWYELWVPQDPAAWPAPKLIFLDIAAQPVFWIDTDGGVVNGECYWLRCEGQASTDLLWLALAVANSSFIEAFYDRRFNNRLYQGRRRFITQYVAHFPLPDPARAESRELIALAQQIHACTPSDEAQALAARLDSLVWQVFGLAPQAMPREKAV